MIRVGNKKCIRNLSRKSLAAVKTRNRIAILAIALTTVLFTSLFTIAMSINTAIQEANFRQVGGFSHGGFKYLTKEQFEEMKDDPLIQERGLRRFLGTTYNPPFEKHYTEISYCDANTAHWFYLDPVEGALPREGTDEAATDLAVLELLGVEPELGKEFTVTFDVDGKETTQTFTLCGWWEKDEAVTASHILVPESRVDAVMKELSVPVPGEDGMTGSYNMDVMFRNASHIEENLETILAKHGYQSESRSGDLPYIATGVNWGYTGAQISDSMDPETVISVSAILLLIILTGYLIIYNVFRISVVGDIRFYGLLKTIGTTGKQIRRIIRQQALTLSLAGIPLGLVLGWLTGSKLTPVVLKELNGVQVDVVSANPLIFAVSAVFSLVTVLLSCRKPGRIASRISPVEGVRYTEGAALKKQSRKGGKRLSLLKMAWANMGRSRSKTAVTVLSLSLAVVLLNTVVMFTNGFDMDKYLSANSVSDFIVSESGYFQTGVGIREPVSEDVIADISSQEGITGGGRVYGAADGVQEFVTEEWFRYNYGQWMEKETLDRLVKDASRDEEGRLADNAQISGMEPYVVDKLDVLDGDISKLKEPGGKYVAAVYFKDDYGNPEEKSHWAKTGDKITLRYVDEWEYYNPETGEKYESWEAVGEQPYEMEALRYRDVEYEVAARVAVPSALSYRYYGRDEFVMNDRTYQEDTGLSNILLYTFDTTKEANGDMEKFLADYTEKVNPSYNYESKATYQAHFESFRKMFLLLGGVLSFIVGLIGVLNFANAILTGILTRKREFAMLQSIGMTGKQLKKMLVYEGLFYSLGSIAAALVISLVLEPVASGVLGGMFWFFTYHLTLAPIFILAPVFGALGCAAPLAVYRRVAKQTIVERLRETEE